MLGGSHGAAFGGPPEEDGPNKFSTHFVGAVTTELAFSNSLEDRRPAMSAIFPVSNMPGDGIGWHSK